MKKKISKISNRSKSKAKAKPGKKQLKQSSSGGVAKPIKKARHLLSAPLEEVQPITATVQVVQGDTIYNNVLTASRINSALSCWRKHFWGNEIGMRKVVETSLALRIGSAWARAMEARWHGSTYEDALAAAIPAGATMFSEYDAATISGLLAAYYDVYGEQEHFGNIHPEVKFESDLGNGWTAQGMIDGLGSLADGRSGIIESKTTSQQLDPDSDFWLRMNFNVQVYQYIVEARKLGWDIATTFYDVTRKPIISPREKVEDLDENGDKIVLDASGERVINQKGKFAGLPKQSADKDKGQYIKSHRESAEEFCDRVYQDAKARPEFYFARREIPVIESHVESFIRTRLLIRDTIEFYRSKESSGDKRDPEAWPRNVSSDTCDFCQFKSFCLQGLSVDLEHPPEGFVVNQFNVELQQKQPTQ